MNGKTKTERHQERKVQKRQAAKKRKAKTTCLQTEVRRRQADLEWRKRQQQPHKARPLAAAKARRQAVRRYRHLKEVRCRRLSGKRLNKPLVSTASASVPCAGRISCITRTG